MLHVLGEKPFIAMRGNTKIASVSDSTIFLDFPTKRRSSFLPDELVDDGQVPSGIQINWDKHAANKQMTSCGATFRPISTPQKVIKKFITGSKYLGQWNQLGIAGKGIYKYPHGVLYDGHFNKNGEFHGSGILIYPNGQRLEGFWRNGVLSPEPTFITKENNVYNEDYCRMPDRRFQIEIQSELQPAFQERLTNSPEPIKIPDYCYDTGEGFFDPKLKVIKRYDDTVIMRPLDNFVPWLNEERRRDYKLLLSKTPSEKQFLDLLARWKDDEYDIESIPASNKEAWIKKNCRYAWSRNVGYQPEYYEAWTTGSRRSSFPQLAFDRENTSISISGISDATNCLSAVLEPDGSFCINPKHIAQNSLFALSTMFINPLSAASLLHFSKKSKHHRIKLHSTISHRATIAHKQSKSFKRYVLPKITV